MDIPSVAVDVHHRYTPEIRDLIDEKLRTAMAVIDDTTYRLLTPSHLRRLAEIASPNAPVLSLYLQLTPERRVGRAWRGNSRVDRKAPQPQEAKPEENGKAAAHPPQRLPPHWTHSLGLSTP